MTRILYGAAGAIVLMLLVALGGSALQVKHLVADRDRWKASAGAYLTAAGAWEASYHRDTSLREREGQAAIGAANAATKACDTRVATARRSSAAIQTIITKEPIYDQAHCPVRRSVGVDLLRDAAGLAAAR